MPFFKPLKCVFLHLCTWWIVLAWTVYLGLNAMTKFCFITKWRRCDKCPIEYEFSNCTLVGNCSTLSSLWDLVTSTKIYVKKFLKRFILYVNKLKENDSVAFKEISFQSKLLKLFRQNAAFNLFCNEITCKLENNHEMLWIFMFCSRIVCT